MRILLVEDDGDLGPVIALGLRNEAYAVDLATTCAEAEELLRSNDFDVACLDLGLPDGDGLDLLRRLGADPALRRPRRSSCSPPATPWTTASPDSTPAPTTTSSNRSASRSWRRACGPSARRSDVRESTLHVGDLRLDSATHRAWRAGSELELTPREFSMLRYLMHHPGRTVSAEELLEHVWDAHADPFTASVRVILSRLRRKLGDPGADHHRDRRRLPAAGHAVTGAMRSLRVRLALTGSLAIYLPVVLLFAVTAINQREVVDIAPDGTAAGLADQLDRRRVDAFTVIALPPATAAWRGGGRGGRCARSSGSGRPPSGSRPPI